MFKSIVYVFIILIINVTVLVLQISACNSSTSHHLKSNNDDHSSPIDLMEVMSLCNESFRIPMEYLEDFNVTGRFADENDKTAMCYLRCYFEKGNFIENEKFIKQKVQETWWPATGDSVEVCNKEGTDERNPCVRIYSKARCLMLRAIVDARNQQSV